MDNEFSAIMSRRTDAELIEVLNSSPGDYVPLALAAAKIELKKRNLSNEQIALAKDEIEQKHLADAPNNEPLSTGDKVLAIIFPRRIFSTLLWRTYTTDGPERYKERIRWQIYGLCFYTVIFLVMVIITLISK